MFDNILKVQYLYYSCRKREETSLIILWISKHILLVLFVFTTKDTGHAGGRISLHSGGSNRRHDSTAFITNAGELSVGKLRSCVSKTAGTF